MSAFVCSKKHIAALANYAVAKKICIGGRLAGPGDFESIYKTLASENVRSVCSRYADDHADDYADFVRPTGRGTLVVDNPVSIIKLAQCLEYQSNETSDWKETLAHAFVRQIINAAINALPGYDAAPWAIA